MILDISEQAPGAFRIAISAVYAFWQLEIINIQKMVYIQT